MLDLPSLRPETRYGMPAADQIIFNRDYVIGYSYYFRQAKWALELLDPEKEPENFEDEPVDRSNNFRSDYRVPQMFRADKSDYKNSGYDRGHLIPSANKLEKEVQNSETFLLSNMSPQHADLNRKIWRILEKEVRDLAADPKIYETFVICGPIFDFNTEVLTIGAMDNNGVTLPVPHYYFKSILTENHRGALEMWSFIIPNKEKEADQSLKDFLVPTTHVEKFSGLFIWDRLVGEKMEDKKVEKKEKMWTV